MQLTIKQGQNVAVLDLKGGEILVLESPAPISLENHRHLNEVFERLGKDLPKPVKVIVLESGIKLWEQEQVRKIVREELQHISEMRCAT